jgi:predicted aspartyl protease
MRRAALALVLLAFSASAADEPAADAVLAALPFDPTQHGRIVIDLAPAGNARKLPLQLDTGATASVVTPALARALGVKVNPLRQDPHRRKTALGRDLLFYVDTRRSDTAANRGFEYGLLGGDFLADYVVELDFTKRQVRFLDPDRYAVPEQTRAPDETVLDLMLVSNRPGVDVKVNGRAVKLLLDTGAGLGLMLSGANARKVKLAYEDGAPCNLQGTVGGTTCHITEVERLELGSLVLESQRAFVAPNGFYNLGFAGDSVIGYELLEQFLVRIDYPRERLWLRRAAPFAHTGADGVDPEQRDLP